MVGKVLLLARQNKQKVVRLDVLKGNIPAKKLYTHMGFQYIDTVQMFYEDTGWTDYELFEYVLADIEMERLKLRRWQASDLEPFIRMNQDAEVMRYFPNTLTADETRQFYERIVQEFAEYGYGLYATEEKCSGDFIGFIGFHWARFEVEFCPCVEIGWRLDQRYWGRGYATEGASACLKYGFDELQFDKIYSFTSVKNKASQRVMQKIGLKLERYFDHPKVESGNLLRPHVCYWTEKQQISAFERMNKE